MDNTTSAPAQRNEHLTTMPDSVDIICLMNPDNLHPTLAGEFAKVRRRAPGSPTSTIMRSRNSGRKTCG